MYEAPAEALAAHPAGVRRYGGTLTLRKVGASIDFESFLDSSSDDPKRKHQSVLDVVFKAQSTARCKCIGDAFYDAMQERNWARSERIGQLSELWLGYRTSIVRTEHGPMLQVDRASSCMLAAIRLDEFVAQKLRQRPHQLRLVGRGAEARLGDVPIALINKKLTEGKRNTKVSARHRTSHDGRPLMEYVVRGLDTCPCNEATFLEVCGTCAKCNDPAVPKKGPAEDRCGMPQQITVAAWFARQFPNVHLHRPDLPCVLVGPQNEPRGGRPKLPLELCSLLPGQPAQEIGTTELQAMIKETAAKPSQRFSDIDLVVLDQFASGGGGGGRGGGRGGGEYGGRGGGEYGGGGGEPRQSEGLGNEIAGFGMRVEPARVIAKGRVLDPCTLMYGRNQRIVPKIENVPHFAKGGWNLSRTTFQKPAVADGWAIVYCTRPEPSFKVDTFIETLKRVADERCMRLGQVMGQAPIDANEAIRRHDLEAFLTDQVQRLDDGARGRAKVELLVCVISDAAGANGKYVYPALKRWSHTVSGIPVQCVQASKALKVGSKKHMAGDAQYAAGLLLKINLKLGGENAYVITPDSIGRDKGGISLMMAAPTMVVGLDVHHPAPGSQGASYAAVVASLDQKCVKFRTIVTEQGMVDDGRRGATGKVREEIVRTLEESMITLLKDYARHNRFPPKRIIFFRDGVAHNQFQAVTDVEVDQIRRACEIICGTSAPHLVFVVTQMRTRTRLAVKSGGQGGEEWQNVTPGTVVDRDITGGNFEWYMIPHHALQGSARASHYHVLHNDACLTPDELQRFAFDLCHLYGRATKIVSRPAHLYYAHLAAALGPYYDAGYMERDVEHWDVQSMSSHGSGGSGTRRELHKDVTGRVYYA